jgi:hypothetical protein
METNAIINNSWPVKLEDHHPYFSEIRLWRNLAYSRNYTVVIVDAEQLLSCWQRHVSFLPPVEQWKKDEVDGIRSYLQSARPLMARPVIETRPQTGTNPLFSPDGEGVVQFANGRHRTRYMYDAGAKSFPVEVLVSQVELFRQYCVNGI